MKNETNVVLDFFRQQSDYTNVYYETDDDEDDPRYYHHLVPFCVPVPQGKYLNTQEPQTNVDEDFQDVQEFDVHIPMNNDDDPELNTCLLTAVMQTFHIAVRIKLARKIFQNQFVGRDVSKKQSRNGYRKIQFKGKISQRS